MKYATKDEMQVAQTFSTIELAHKIDEALFNKEWFLASLYLSIIIKKYTALAIMTIGKLHEGTKSNDTQQ